MKLSGFIEDTISWLNPRKGEGIEKARVMKWLKDEDEEGFVRDSEVLGDVARQAANKLAIHVVCTSTITRYCVFWRAEIFVTPCPFSKRDY